MTMAWPIVNAASSEQSHSTAAAISSGLPIRPIGSWAITLAAAHGVTMTLIDSRSFIAR
jgi:hypothetical protein